MLQTLWVGEGLDCCGPHAVLSRTALPTCAWTRQCRATSIMTAAALLQVAKGTSVDSLEALLKAGSLAELQEFNRRFLNTTAIKRLG